MLLRNFYCALAELAKKDSDLGQTHSVEEAEDNESDKAEARAEDSVQ